MDACVRVTAPLQGRTWDGQRAWPVPGEGNACHAFAENRDGNSARVVFHGRKWAGPSHPAPFWTGENYPIALPMLLYLIFPTRAAQFIYLVPFAAAIPVDSALGLTRKESSGTAVPFAASTMPQGKQAYWRKLWPRQGTGRTVQTGRDRTLRGIVESCRGEGNGGLRPKWNPDRMLERVAESCRGEGNGGLRPKWNPDRMLERVAESCRVANFGFICENAISTGR